MKNIYLVIFLLAVLGLAICNLVFAGCGGSGMPDGYGQMPECNQPAAASSAAVNTGNKICPVLGEPIDEASKATYEYEGKIYNFCCAMCIDTFKKEPQKYIDKVNRELQAGQTNTAPK